MSKVEGTNPLGIMHYTFTQEAWNSHTDVIEYDDEGNVSGIWCDLLKDTNLPSDKPNQPDASLSSDYAEITYAGAEPHIKVNGSYKKITIIYYSTQSENPDQTPGVWSYFIDDTDVSDLIKELETDSPNSIKIKFLGDEEYLGRTLVVKNIRDNITAELQLFITSL